MGRVEPSGRPRADIHDGPEHMLQSEAGYINARPHPTTRRNLLATHGRTSAAKLAAIPAGESPANRDAMGRAARTMAPSSLQRINGAPHATAERFEQIPRNSRTKCNTDRRDRDGSVELARRRYRAWCRAPAVEKARGRRKRITEVAASMARGSGAGRTQDQTHRCRFRGRP